MSVTYTDGFTVADLEAMPDDGKRYELIGGSIIMNPAPGVDHQRGSRRLQAALESAFGPEYEVFNAPIDLHLPTGDVLEPDLVVVEAGRTGKHLEPPVLLVVELISPGLARHDTVTKLDAYARGGIEHYWMVDTRATHRGFRALRLNDGRYDTTTESTEKIDTKAPVRLTIAIEDLFRLR